MPETRAAWRRLVCYAAGHDLPPVSVLRPTGREVMVARLTAAPERVQVARCRRCGREHAKGGFALAGDPATRRVTPAEARAILAGA